MSSDALNATHRLLSVPKGEGTGSEDAAAARTDAWPLRAAVADGATESAYAGRWAQLIVNGLVGMEMTPRAVSDAWDDWQAQWHEEVVAPDADRPWYVRAKLDEGAFATMMGLEVFPNGQWRAVSVGDCCLFHVRDGALERSWPYDNPDAFTNRPALVPSRSNRDLPPIETASGTWRRTDTFLLATDAVAAWLLRDGVRPACDWSAAAFRDAVQAARARNQLRLDDATLLVLRVDGEAAEERRARE